MRVRDKAVIVTVSGGTIAKAYAMVFAREGARVSLLGIAGAEHLSVDFSLWMIAHSGRHEYER